MSFVLLAVRCLMFVVCWLLSATRWLHRIVGIVACCSLFAVCCTLAAAVCYLLVAVRCSLFVASCLLAAVSSLLVDVC